MSKKETSAGTKLRKIAAGHYETEYRGHKVELIDLRQAHGAASTEWIAPIDGSNDIEPRWTRAEALSAARYAIDAMNGVEP